MKHSIAIVSELLALVERIECIERERTNRAEPQARLNRDEIAQMMLEMMADRKEDKRIQRDQAQSWAPPRQSGRARPRPGGMAAGIVRRLGIAKHNLHGAVHAHGRNRPADLSDVFQSDECDR